MLKQEEDHAIRIFYEYSRIREITENYILKKVIKRFSSITKMNGMFTFESVSQPVITFA